MPRLTERQQQMTALLDAYVVNLVAQFEADMWKATEPSDPESDDEFLQSPASPAHPGTPIDIDSDSSSEADPLADHIGDTIIAAVEELYRERYINERRDIPKTEENLRLLLDSYRHNFPDIFRSYLRISPDCFNELVKSIEHHPAFSSNSNNEQMPVKDQVAIALYRFGHYGNAASTMKVALWAGVGYGTVRNVTIRVMTALCDERFRRVTMPWSSPQEIERAKAWVEGNSCPAWRDGWLMVDGTLVPLFQRPHHFGNQYFDRKSNYSLNVQLISRPDLRILDYGIGLPGSQHDATAWNQTRLPHEHQHLLGEDEFVWADSAYPLKSWCQAPYKEPEKLQEDNTTHNYYVSRIRIRSEHCVGYLKGRWSSLRGIRLRIDNPMDQKFATLWVASCIHLHNFALRHENKENPETDNFFAEGQLILEEERERQMEWERLRREQMAQEEENYEDDEEIELLEGKLKREQLKEALFEYIGRDV
ncbi:putative DDE superfamily endonuclease [Lyophyllum shimeji]|uniref:DDE superfamily endonuclease n=1 Tax=Lyophyllum shimeji TaxID=47721 RepID=A0A9P3PGG8_LYOSH|nr:putative DDE superfamily endonuclease [Lyophyllum shimeji]